MKHSGNSLHSGKAGIMANGAFPDELMQAADRHAMHSLGVRELDNYSNSNCKQFQGNEDARINLLDALGFGEEEARSARELVSLLGLSDERSLRAICHDLRRDELVLSSSAGYFRPKRIEEVEAFYHRMMTMSGSTREAARCARDYLRKHEDELIGQLSFF